MSTATQGITTVVFNASALFYESGTGPQAMPHAQEVLQFLQSKDIRLVSCFEAGTHPEDMLRQVGLENLFIREDTLQTVYASQETERDIELNLKPLTYYRGLSDLGISTDNTATIAGHHEEIKEAKASGIKQVIGFYGSPAIPFGQVQATKNSLERDMTPLAGTPLTIANLRQVPEYLNIHP